ncbi:MAG: triose-phosphate isomerase [Pseudomonadota bacterium]|nr:triose-phosphate isomerase [Pseudomonadota bacterium]
MRKPLVAGNWKMNGSRAENQQLVSAIHAGAAKISDVDLLVCPPFVYLTQIAEQLAGSKISLGAQNVADQPSGAFTGEVSASMLREAGCSYAIVGHSERRHIYGESDELVAARASQAVQQGLTPILCVGETLAERESGVTEQVIERQLSVVKVLAGMTIFQDLVIAYEPVWAIGTGQTATPEQAQSVHSYIREWVGGGDEALAATIRILYGGSVKSDNAAELFHMPDIDGGLIGGASLQADSFLAIAEAAVGI